MPEALGKGIVSYISSIKAAASEPVEDLLNLLVVESLAPLEA